MPVAPIAVRLFVQRFTDFWFDKLTGMETSKRVELDELGFAADRGERYDATTWFKLLLLQRILRGLAISKKDVFVDFGSGMGRVLFMAARFPFGKIIGVELSAQLNGIASQYIAKNRHRFMCQNIELVTADVTDYDIPDTVTVAYFYNPFGGQVFIDVVDRFCASLVRCPRDFKLIYLNPTMHDYLSQSGFRVVKRVRNLVLYEKQ